MFAAISPRKSPFFKPPEDTNMQKLPKVLVLAGLAGLPFVSGVARAEDPPPEHSFTGKAALYSEYEYRGISQTSEKAAGRSNFLYAPAKSARLGTSPSNKQQPKGPRPAHRLLSNAKHHVQ